jgi:glutamate synthase domain-containing protein 1
MTTKERLHKLVDGLSEAEADAALEFVVSRGRSEHTEEAEMLPLPPSWQTLPSGRPVPNWVAGLDEVRNGR